MFGQFCIFSCRLVKLKTTLTLKAFENHLYYLKENSTVLNYKKISHAKLIQTALSK